MWVAMDPHSADTAPQEGILNIRDFAVRGEAALDRVCRARRNSPAVRRRASTSRACACDFTRSPGRFTVRDGVVKGPAIGATIDGYIDYTRDDVRMRGTFVPLYGLNNMFGQIPIVGLFLGGSNEGLVGITYEVVGPPSTPVLRVNPISAVAPGLLRKFFEFPSGNGRDSDRPQSYRAMPTAIAAETPDQTGFSSTWRFRPSESLITPSGVRCSGVSIIFSSVTVASLTLQPAALDLPARLAVRRDQAGFARRRRARRARPPARARQSRRVGKRFGERAFLEGRAARFRRPPRPPRGRAAARSPRSRAPSSPR